MKIIHVVYSMTFGGIETMLVNIANVQAGDNEVYLLMINNHYDEALIRGLSKKVKFINVGRPVSSKNPYYILKLNYLLWALHADVIHIHLSPILKVVFYPFFKKKMVFTMHDIPLSEEQKILKYARYRYAISKAVQESLRKLGYKSIIVNNGINPNIFQKKDSTNRDLFRIVQIGRLATEKKGQDLLIKACRVLVERKIKEFHVDFIGNGPSENELKELVEKLGLNHYISFLGVKDQTYISSHLKDYSLFVQPSRREGFGLTVAEAMASKVPVLVSNQEGPLEIIENGTYGFFFEKGNYHSLADSIEKIMNTDSGILKDLTTRALSHIEQRYNVASTAKQYLEQYKIFLERKKSIIV